MYKQVHSKGVSIINGPYRVKTKITYSIYAIRLSMAHKGGRALFALGALKSILTRFRGQVMQLHYSH